MEKENKELKKTEANYEDFNQSENLSEDKSENLSQNNNENLDDLWLDEDDDEEVRLPPEMPKKLPKLIELLVSQTPDIYKPAVAHAVFPSLAAHLYKTSFEYIDGVEHEATLMNVLMAPTGAGKSCVNAPISHIMADIRKRDNENMQREKEWKQVMNTMGTHKYKPKRPDNIIIQEVQPDMTSAAFILRMHEAKGRFLYSQMNEIDCFDALDGYGKGSHKGLKWRIICLAFDPGNQYGQTRIMPGAVNERVHILYNWNASTTIQHGRQYFKHVVNDGPISRINFCTIPEREIGADMPIYGEYDEAFDDKLRPYINRLTKVRGLIDCPEATLLIEKLRQECRAESISRWDRIYENLSFRALVIAYLKACVLYVANGCKWEPEIDEFIRWSLHYDLWCKMEFFWDLIDDEENGRNARIGSRGPKNLLQELPNSFTWADAERLREQHGLKISGTREMLKSWMKRGHLEYDSVSVNTTFQKAWDIQH